MSCGDQAGVFRHRSRQEQHVVLHPPCRDARAERRRRRRRQEGRRPRPVGHHRECGIGLRVVGNDTTPEGALTGDEHFKFVAGHVEGGDPERPRPGMCEGHDLVVGRQARGQRDRLRTRTAEDHGGHGVRLGHGRVHDFDPLGIGIKAGKEVEQCCPEDL